MLGATIVGASHGALEPSIGSYPGPPQAVDCEGMVFSLETNQSVVVGFWNGNKEAGVILADMHHCRRSLCS